MFPSFLTPSREKSHNESRVAEISLLAVLIVITCIASNVKIIQSLHQLHILLRAEVSKNSLQHINSCLKVSCCHNALSLSLNIPKGEGITRHKGDF